MNRTKLLALALLAGLSACGEDKKPIRDTDAGQDGGSVAAECGNGVAEGSEMCDGSDKNGETCASATMGVLSEGTLGCTARCNFDVSECVGDDAGTDEDGGGVGGTGG